MTKFKKLKWVLVFLATFTCLAGFGKPAFASKRMGVPPILINKYWKYTPQNSSLTQYFYGTRGKFFAKNTVQGNFNSSVLSWACFSGYYTMQGIDSKKPNYFDWWFIKPNKNYSRIRFGYITIPKTKIPKHSPSYYANKVATRTSSVTAILH